jgi:hypothetical protein
MGLIDHLIKTKQATVLVRKFENILTPFYTELNRGNDAMNPQQ